MDNLARESGEDDILQITGTVVDRKGPAAKPGQFEVRSERGTFTAKRAVSCLVEPEPGDEVLLAVGTKRCHVLAVLEREDGAPVTLTHDGDLRMRLLEGRFTVAAQKGISLMSGDDVSVVTGSMDVKAEHGNFIVKRLSVLGSYAQAEISKVKLVGQTLDTVVERVSQRVKRSYRWVAEIDQTKAEMIDYEAKKLMRIHGKAAVITSEDLVKVDGGQIHMG